MTILDPSTTHRQIADFAAKLGEKRKNSVHPVRRLDRQMKPGEWWRQGDLYGICLAKLPKDAVKQVFAPGDRVWQLVPGASMGSRHCLRLTEGVEFYRKKNAGPLDGGYIVAADRVYVEHHPGDDGHAHIDYCASVVEVRYQRDLATEEIRRVRD